MQTFASQTDIQTDYQTVFDRQRHHAPTLALTTADDRITRLKRLQAWIISQQAAIEQALYDDFRKPATEVLMSEWISLNAEINYTCKHLKRWMKPQPLPTPMSLVGTRSHIRYEPKGIVLVISPWNYPFVLTVKPLVSALAAGNTVILKPSELTPHTTALLKRMVSELFLPEEVALFAGDASVAQALLALPFNHIFFTGSPAVGKLVMTAAARHLASVTLELGGKSPCIVDETANLKQAAEQIAWGKSLNNGQTCVAPDYLLIHQSVKDAFVDEFRGALQRMYNSDGRGVQASASYCRLVSQHHFARVRDLIEAAVQQGATVPVGGQMDAQQNFIEPTLLDKVTDTMRIMQEEIFGPVLPLQTFTDPAEVIRRINQREKPLALYIHSQNRQRIRYFLERTTAGDTVINDVMLQFSNPELPFGGVNNSGLGKSNGFFSFQEFSNSRGVMERRFGTMKFAYPPYTTQVTKLFNWLKLYV